MEQTIIRLAIGLVLLVAVNVVLGSLNALLTGLSTVSNAGTASLRGSLLPPVSSLSM